MSWPRARFRRGPRQRLNDPENCRVPARVEGILHRIAGNERLFAGQQLIPKVRGRRCRYVDGRKAPLPVVRRSS